MIRNTGLSRERGAVLVHVAMGLVAIMAVNALVLDYGVMWVARRQAQNTADAAALAAANSLAFVDANDQALARESAIATAMQHRIWDGPPDITPADVTFPPCPAGAPGVADTCVRVDVFRNQRAGGNPLPTYFGQLVGLTEQGVRATASAQLVAGNSTDCIKPWAVADKWIENTMPPTGSVPGWDPDDTFERYVQNGNNRGALLPNPDEYIPAGPTCGPSDPWACGSGFLLPPMGSDYGYPFTLKPGNPQQAIRPGWFFAVVINPLEGPGGSNYRDNIATCDQTIVNPGDYLTVEPGNMIGPTRQGVDDLIAQDPGGRWVGGPGGGPTGCAADPIACVGSPRMVKLPVFDADAYDSGRTGGRTDILIVKILGFWIDRRQGNDVIGYLSHYPATPERRTNDASSFVRTVVLVR